MSKNKDFGSSFWDNFTMDRREFIKRSSAAAVTAGMASHALSRNVFAEETPVSGGMKYRTLGRTGLKVSEMSFGAIQLHNTGLTPLYRAFELGVNYIDTASGYGRGNSERNLSEFLKEHKDEVYVATKWSGQFRYDAEKEPHISTTKEDLIRVCEECLSRMKIDTVDVIQMHGMSRPEQVESPVALEAFEELKKAGKARFLGVSTHSNEDAVINKAVEMGYFDVILTVYNFMSPRELTRAIANAKKADVGIVIMKALKPLTGFAKQADHPDEIYRTSLRWVLANKNVTNIIPTMRTLQEVEQDVSVVGTKVSYNNMKQLEEYAQALNGEYCRMCGTCSGACPQGVATDDIIRYASYYTDYGDRDRALELHRDLEPSQTMANCNNCGACNSACPYNLDVVGKLERAHALLA